MIRTLKRRFITAAMAAVTILLVLLLGAVNAVNAWTTARDAERLLDELVQLELQGRPALPRGEDFPAGEEPPTPWGSEPLPQPEKRPRGFMGAVFTENDRMAAVYVTVRLRDGAPVRADVSRISDLSEAEAAAMAADAAAKGLTEGKTDRFRFASAADQDGERVYIFLENSSRRNAVLRVAALSALAGLGGWLLMLGLVVLLARRTIAPVAENMERQRRFVTDAGHELKTPLAIIRANTEAMELIAGENKWSRNIKAQTERLTELTGNLLTLARAEELPKPGSLTPLDLTALTEKTAAMFRTPMEQRRLRLETELEGEVRVRGDETQLRSLLSILLDNAVKYAAEGSDLRLRLRAGEKSCVLRLENDCEALPACPPERLFDRFYRADAARTQKAAAIGNSELRAGTGAQAAGAAGTGGFGIGLSAARVIVQRHRGHIEAEYLNGTRIAFTVTLPI